MTIGELMNKAEQANVEITNATAMWFLYARIAQSVVHLASTSTPAVMLRFAFRRR